MSQHEITVNTFRELSNALNENLLEYGDELGDLHVFVQDDDGILHRKVIAIDLAGGLYIIVSNEDAD